MAGMGVVSMKFSLFLLLLRSNSSRRRRFQLKKLHELDDSIKRSWLPCSTRKTFHRKRLKIPAKTPCCVCCLSAVYSKLQKFMLLLTPLLQLAMAAWLGSLWSPSVVLYCCYCCCCVCCAVNKKDVHNFHSHFGYPHGLALCCNRIPKK